MVTGNRGFVGQAMEARLLASGHDVVGFDIADGHDITEPELMAEKAEGCEAIIFGADQEGRLEDEMEGRRGKKRLNLTR